MKPQLNLLCTRSETKLQPGLMWLDKVITRVWNQRRPVVQLWAFAAAQDEEIFCPEKIRAAFH